VSRQEERRSAAVDNELNLHRSLAGRFRCSNRDARVTAGLAASM